MTPLPDWEAVLSAASRLQSIVPGAVLVGGSASAIYALHRRSHDADHVPADLRTRFDQVMASLDEVAGWRFARANRPVLILGNLDGIETGVRQLIRTEPLKTRRLQTRQGLIVLPTRLECLRIKGALILRRNATRDYVDFVALADTIGARRLGAAMAGFDHLYPQPDGESATRQLAVQLASPRPYDREATDLATYKGLIERYNSWAKLEPLSRLVSNELFRELRDRGGK